MGEWASRRVREPAGGLITHISAPRADGRGDGGEGMEGGMGACIVGGRWARAERARRDGEDVHRWRWEGVLV